MTRLVYQQKCSIQDLTPLMALTPLILTREGLPCSIGRFEKNIGKCESFKGSGATSVRDSRQ